MIQISVIFSLKQHQAVSYFFFSEGVPTLVVASAIIISVILDGSTVNSIRDDVWVVQNDLLT